MKDSSVRSYIKIIQTDMHLPLSILCSILLFASCTAEATNEYRLPTHIRPVHYDLHILIVPQDQHFQAKIEIELEVQNGTAGVLFLHADGNYIDVTNVTKDHLNCSFIKPNQATQIFSVKCTTEFKSGDKVLIHYQGSYSTTEMTGLYKSTYDNGTLLVTTLLQPVYARKAFPCFDEPSFKATYSIVIVHPNQYHALANTPPDFITKGRNCTISQFQKTPPMSSYLVAFIVSEFESAIKGDHSFNVFARPSAAHNMGIAAHYGQQLFDAMSQWIGIVYEDMGNPQAYLAAIPDFSAGAMENWGLITFLELDLLDEGNRTSSATFRQILQVMAHEIAHQWFGNYVTVDWWTNTWLNEGFATYFSQLMVDMIEADLEQEKQFVTEQLQVVMQKDTTLSTFALSTPENSTNTPVEAISKFDFNSYYKGASIIRMMRYILGDVSFQKGLQIYLTKHKYKNVNPSNLIKSLQTAAGRHGEQVTNFDIKMHNWIYNPGFPLLTVNQTNSTTVTVTQERFLGNKNWESKDQWYVPLSYTNEKTHDFNVQIKDWLKPNEPYEIPHDEKDWIIFNIQQSGFYRVNYDTNLWQNIIRVLHTDEERETVDPLNRAQLIDDIFQIARVGKVPYRTAFDLATYLKKERSIHPWVSTLREFKFLLDVVDDETYKLLTRFILDLISTAFPGSYRYVTRLDKIKEAIIYGWRCKVGEADCLSSAEKQFQDFKNKKSELDTDKRETILCYGMKKSNDLFEDFHFLLNLLKESQSPAEKNAIIVALGCVEDDFLLMDYLNKTLLPNSPIRQQDFQMVFNAVYYDNKVGVAVALEFLEDNLKRMDAAYGGGNVLSSLLTDFASKLSTPEQMEQMKQILMSNEDNENVKLSKAAVMDTININVQWNAEYGREIKHTLKQMTAQAPSTYSINFTISFYILLVFGSIYLTVEL